MPRVKKYKCSFCTSSKEDVDILLAGPKPKTQNGSAAYICDECIKIAYKEITTKNKTVAKKHKLGNGVTPESIKANLDEYIVGQENAKKILSIAVYNHYKRINNPIVNGVVIDKSNIMLMGPSGCGKTLLVSTIANALDIPYVIADSTSITEAGYHGNDVEMIFERLYKNANYDINKAQNGIVFIDEIDKKTNKSIGTGHKDVSGEGVQMSLLRMIEGDKVRILSSKRGETEIEFDTKNVLFIVGGAFVGLDKIIEKRMNKGTTVGFCASLKDTSEKHADFILSKVEPDDIHEFGFIREFIGRFPLIVPLHGLTTDDLIKVIKEPKNSLLSQYKAIFSVDGVELNFSDEYIHNLAKNSMEKKTGARGLRSMIEKDLMETQFNLPSLKKNGVNKITVIKDGSIKIN